jgi:predicted nucleic acid-binding protein
MMKIALDTDVLISGVRSATGASREVLLMVGRGELAAVVTVPMLLEYEAVLKRPSHMKAANLTAHYSAAGRQLHQRISQTAYTRYC